MTYKILGQGCSTDQFQTVQQIYSGADPDALFSDKEISQDEIPIIFDFDQDGLCEIADITKIDLSLFQQARNIFANYGLNIYSQIDKKEREEYYGLLFRLGALYTIMTGSEEIFEILEPYLKDPLFVSALVQASSSDCFTMIGILDTVKDRGPIQFFPAVPEPFLSDPVFAEDAIPGCPNLLGILDPAFQDQKETVLKAVRADGLTLRSASDRLQHEPDVFLAAIEENVFAAEVAPQDLWDNEEFCFAVVNRAPYYFRNCSERLRGSRDFFFRCLEMLFNHPLDDNDLVVQLSLTAFFNHLTQTLREDSQIVEAFVLAFPDRSILPQLNTPFATDPSFRESLVKKGIKRELLVSHKNEYQGLQEGDVIDNEKELFETAHAINAAVALEHAPSFQDNKGIVLRLVQMDGQALKSASPRLQNDPEVVATAARHSFSALLYANPRFLSDKAFILDNFHASQNRFPADEVYLKLDPKLKQDRDILEAFLWDFGFVAFEEVCQNAPQDDDFFSLALKQNPRLVIDCLFKKYAHRPEMALEAIAWNPYFIGEISPEFIHDIEFLSQAVVGAGKNYRIIIDTVYWEPVAQYLWFPKEMDERKFLKERLLPAVEKLEEKGYFPCTDADDFLAELVVEDIYFLILLDKESLDRIWPLIQQKVKEQGIEFPEDVFKDQESFAYSLASLTTFPKRLRSLSTVSILMNNLDHPSEEDLEKPLALLIYPKSDWNEGIGWYPTIDQIVQDGRFFVIYQEVDNEEDILQTIKTASKDGQRPIHTLILAGHGEQQQMLFGEFSKEEQINFYSGQREETTEKKIVEARDFSEGDFQNLDQYLDAEQAQVFLFSCSNGEGEETEDNLGNAFARTVRPTTRIITSRVPMNIESLEIQEDLRLRVEFTDDYPYVVYGRQESPFFYQNLNRFGNPSKQQ